MNLEFSTNFLIWLSDPKNFKISNLWNPYGNLKTSPKIQKTNNANYNANTAKYKANNANYKDNKKNLHIGFPYNLILTTHRTV